ncbi:MAG: DNA translocase FtsK 4TM domain-containing protein, partial [Candidatus Eremiobacteraeota bacterium]|nr:DNA translocase FtsK 4TM domain-containing protein [Candidatus Eremiobacteraeota bacterium]
MARVRRKAAATVRLNFEIAGLAAFGVAVLLALALVFPHASGALGSAVAHQLQVTFGMAAWVVPLLIAIIGAIVFLEINVPRMMATFGFAAVAYFLLLDAAFGRNGGAVGTLLALGLQTLFGRSGTPVVLVLLALLLTVWMTSVSVKRVIGWCILVATRLRERVRALLRERMQRPAATPRVAGSEPKTLREAFGLGARSEAPSTALATVAPVDLPAFIKTETVQN